MLGKGVDSDLTRGVRRSCCVGVLRDRALSRRIAHIQYQIAWAHPACSVPSGEGLSTKLIQLKK
eukprot:699166-Rhodomonas_salina.2